MSSIRLPPRAPAPSALLLATVVLFAAAAAAHSASVADATLRVDRAGQAELSVGLKASDVRDLFDLDPRADNAQSLLEARASRDGAMWLRLATERDRCVLERSAVVAEPEVVRLRLGYRCPAEPKQLVVDWGLSSISSLDLEATLEVEAPDGSRTVSVLSRRRSHADIALVSPPVLEEVGRFSVLGVEHIVFGWDHLAFLFALVLGCAGWARLLLVVTGFTLAHSVTLALGATGVVPLFADVVEPLIAASISLTAASGWWQLTRDGRSRGRYEPLFALGFGLIHGLGFAGMLAAALSSTRDLLPALLGFNLGVEMGQLAVVLIVFSLLKRVRTSRLGDVTSRWAYAGLVVLGLVWVGVRLAGAG